MKRVEVAIGIVYRAGKILICRRRRQDRLGGFWEFPGGKVEGGEGIAACLARELREELDVAVEAVVNLPTIEHDYPDIRVRLHPFLCAYKSGEPKALGCEEVRWIDPGELGDFQFPPANGELLKQVMSYLAR
jgi:8-oxo-dGTP diphosphatase/A/G-specific adenine glycosylase